MQQLESNRWQGECKNPCGNRDFVFDLLLINSLDRNYKMQFKLTCNEGKLQLSIKIDVGIILALIALASQYLTP